MKLRVDSRVNSGVLAVSFLLFGLLCGGRRRGLGRLVGVGVSAVLGVCQLHITAGHGGLQLGNMAVEGTDLLFLCLCELGVALIPGSGLGSTAPSAVQSCYDSNFSDTAEKTKMMTWQDYYLT